MHKVVLVCTCLSNVLNTDAETASATSLMFVSYVGLFASAPPVCFLAGGHVLYSSKANKLNGLRALFFRFDRYNPWWAQLVNQLQQVCAHPIKFAHVLHVCMLDSDRIKRPGH